MKFMTLLKKEIKELMTFQTLISLVITFIAFYAIGGLMEDTMDDIGDNMTKVTIYDEDNTEFTKDMISKLGAGLDITQVEITSTDYAKELKDKNLKSLVILPKGFTDSVVKDRKIASVKYISTMDSFALTSTFGDGGQVAVEAIKALIKEDTLKEHYSALEIVRLELPVELDEITIVGSSSANVSPSVLSAFASSQGTFVPIVIFILILYSAQMIMAAISNEKIDKTLETLLSAPVSRLSVLGSKMLSAGLVAALNAIVYMFAFSKFMGGAMGGSVDTDSTVNEAIKHLGLRLEGMDYVFLGIQMFLTILIALAISIMLGALAKDAKSAQTLIMPIMFLAMIPYMLSMFVDINTLPSVIKLAVYAIPFTHTFVAVPNIIFGQDTLFWAGVVYQLIVLAICMFFAVRLFMTDRILTMSIGFGRKKSKTSKFSLNSLLKKK